MDNRITFVSLKIKTMKRNIAIFPKRQNGLTTTCHRVVEKMEGNPFFPDPPAALAELKMLLPEFLTALANAESRDKYKVAIKNDKKEIVLALLQELASYVTTICKGDRTQILGSGFDATNISRSEGNLPPSIDKLQVTLGAPGIATTRCWGAKGAKAYAYQYTTEPPGLHTEWITDGSSRVSHTFERLKSEKRYWFRVVAIGHFGQIGYSPVVTMVIQ
jgi:hypothetical protein